MMAKSKMKMMSMYKEEMMEDIERRMSDVEILQHASYQSGLLGNTNPSSSSGCSSESSVTII